MSARSNARLVIHVGDWLLFAVQNAEYVYVTNATFLSLSKA
jgi:hypothetical protein